MISGFSFEAHRFPGTSAPVLLQQILRAMENPNSSKLDAVMFAMLSLILRLVATQTTIFNLWYSRRCYERSRGEMITMIYEKTLGRKMIGTPRKPQVTEYTDGGINTSPLEAKKSIFHPQILYQTVRQQVRSIFRSDQPTKPVKEPASMGKILNIMRYV